MEETDLAYAAGIVDGEGCVYIYRNGNGHYSMRLSVDMTDLIAIRWLRETFGGSTYTWQPSGNNKRMFRWGVFGFNAQEFLRLILPYMKTKKSQAEVAIEFQDLKQEKFNQHKQKPAWLIEAEAILHSQMRELNRKGISL